MTKRQKGRSPNLELDSITDRDVNIDYGTDYDEASTRARRNELKQGQKLVAAEREKCQVQVSMSSLQIT